MALVFINENATPAYLALSTDIQSSKINGANLVGKLIYITDTEQWVIINKDLTLSAYNLPVVLSGNLTIGTVAQGAPGALPWKVDGSANPQPVTGTFLTDTQLRATPVPVSGTVSTGALTDTQLRATPVPVSGTVATSNGLTDTQLRATPLAGSDFGLDAISGKIPGVKIVTVYGYNPDIDIADGYETIWGGSTAYTGQNPTSSELVEIYSSSTDDDGSPLGTGARTVTIFGLDNGGVEQLETLTMNGVTAVTSTKTYKRVLFAQVATAGSTGSNVGTITCRQSVTTTNVFLTIAPTFCKSMVCAYTIPAGFKGYIKAFGASVHSKNTSSCQVILKDRHPGEPFHVQEIISVRDTNSIDRVYPYLCWDTLEAGVDIRLDSNTDVNNTTVAGYICLLLEAV